MSEERPKNRSHDYDMIRRIAELKAELLREKSKDTIHLIGLLTDWTVTTEQDHSHAEFDDGKSTYTSMGHRIVVEAKYSVPAPMTDAVLVAVREKMKDDSFDMTVVNGALQIAEEAEAKELLWETTARGLEAACGRYREALETIRRATAHYGNLRKLTEITNKALNSDQAGTDFLKEVRDMRAAVNERKADIASKMLADLPEFDQ